MTSLSPHPVDVHVSSAAATTSPSTSIQGEGRAAIYLSGLPSSHLYLPSLWFIHSSFHHPPITPPTYPSTVLNTHQCLIAIGPSSHPSIQPPIHPSIIFLSTYCLPPNLSLRLSIDLPIHPSTYPLTNYPIHPSIHSLPSSHPSISPPYFPQLCQPTCQPVYRSIHLFIQHI